MPNSVYFRNLCKHYDIVCIQEQCCWDFQSHELSTLATGKEKKFIRCSDQNDHITGFRLPRGKGGVAILWPQKWSCKMKKLTDGNERIIAVELCGDENICITNVYLPTNNSSVNSHLKYTECLDTLRDILLKYRLSHKIIRVVVSMEHFLKPEITISMTTYFTNLWLNITCF